MFPLALAVALVCFYLLDSIGFPTLGYVVVALVAISSGILTGLDERTNGKDK
jgi:hypothetical protein